MGPFVLHTPQYHSPTPHPSPRPIRPAPPHSRGGLLYHQCRFATIPIPTPPPGLFGPPPPTPGGGCYTIKTCKTCKTCLPPALRPAPPPQAEAGIGPLPCSVVPPSRPYPRKRGWDMPSRRHPEAEFPLPLLASLAAPSPASGDGNWPPPSLGRSSLPSLPPQAGVEYACPWTSCNGLPPPPAGAVRPRPSR